MINRWKSITEHGKAWGINKAVAFGILSKVWRLLSVPISVFLIATYFSPKTQGYFYTFSSLLALSVFAELGLNTVIIQFSCHEWAHLHLEEQGSIGGDADSLSRLSSIARFSLRWFFIAALAQFFVIGFGGYLFLKTSNPEQTFWVVPWAVLTLIAAVNTAFVPFWGLLEGCNQVTSVYLFRLVAAVLSTLAAWVGILAGGDLWAPVIELGMANLVGIAFLFGRFRTFFICILRVPAGPTLSWRQDLLPIQWQFALSWLAGYFWASFFTPVLFRLHGPEIAGKMGMTWSLVFGLSTFTGAWIAPYAPTFGILIAQRKFQELDRLFWRILQISLGIMITGGLGFWLFTLGIHHFQLPLSIKFLPPLPTGIFLLAQTILVVQFPMATYLRAHKKEPYMMLTVIGGACIAILNLMLGYHFGVTGMAGGYFLVVLVTTPIAYRIWEQRKNEWHRSDSQDP